MLLVCSLGVLKERILHWDEMKCSLIIWEGGGVMHIIQFPVNWGGCFMHSIPFPDYWKGLIDTACVAYIKWTNFL